MHGKAELAARSPVTMEGARFLVSEAGRRALAAAAMRVAEAGRLDEFALVAQLRRAFDAERAAAIADVLKGRASLVGRHPRAAEMFATHVAAQQASSAPVAAWRARRFRDFGKAVDLTCGAGFDLVAMAGATRSVGVDLDPVRLLFARANAETIGVRLLGLVRGSATAFQGDFDAAFADPDRRTGSQRNIDPERSEPPLADLLAALKGRPLGVKLSPLTDPARLESRGEVEFLSSQGELKEVVLWTGGLASACRRVSLPDVDFTMTGAPVDWPAPAVPSGYLYDPDPALLRSGLLGVVAKEHGLAPIDPSIAYFSGPDLLRHPALSAYRILAVLGPSARSVRGFLAERGLGRIAILRRGFAVAPEDFLKAVANPGSGSVHLHLTRVLGRPKVIATEIDAAETAPPEQKTRCGVD